MVHGVLKIEVVTILHYQFTSTLLMVQLPVQNVFIKVQRKKANELASAVANVLGIKNRGAKSRPNLYMMNIGFDNLIEVCFHDNSSDLNKYNAVVDKVAKAIADVVNGVKINTSDTQPTIIRCNW